MLHSDWLRYYLTIIPRARLGSESIDSEAMRARGIIIVLLKSSWLVKNIENKKIGAS